MHSPQRPSKPDLTPPAAPRPDSVRLRGRRSPRLIALGILLVCLGGLGAASLYTMNARHEPVLVMAADVRRGEVVDRGDVAVIDVPDTLTVDRLPASELDTLIGHRALTDLPSGAFPLARHVGVDPLPDGQALVGLRLPLGRLPSSDLPLGTAVRVVALGDPQTPAIAAVTMVAPTLLDDGTTYALDVRVPDSAADAVARLSAADQLAIVVVAS